MSPSRILTFSSQVVGSEWDPTRAVGFLSRERRTAIVIKASRDASHCRNALVATGGMTPPDSLSTLLHALQAARPSSLLDDSPATSDRNDLEATVWPYSVGEVDMYGTVDSVVEKMRGGERATSQPVNFVDFHLSGDSRLARQVSPPRFMQRVCVNHRYGSRSQRQAQRSIPGIDVGLVISEEGSRTKAHEDYGHAAVWFYVHVGRKTFDLTWIAGEKAMEVELTSGDMLILPPRLRHSVVTHEDTIAFSQNFLLLERWQDILAANAVLIGTRNEQNIFHRVMECAWVIAAEDARLLLDTDWACETESDAFVVPSRHHGKPQAAQRLQALRYALRLKFPKDKSRRHGKGSRKGDDEARERALAYLARPRDDAQSRQPFRRQDGADTAVKHLTALADLVNYPEPPQ